MFCMDKVLLAHCTLPAQPPGTDRQHVGIIIVEHWMAKDPDVTPGAGGDQNQSFRVNIGFKSHITSQ